MNRRDRRKPIFKDDADHRRCLETVSETSACRGSGAGLDPRQERRPVHSTIEHHRRRHATKPEAADESRRLPMTVRGRTQAAGAAQRPPAQPGHLGRRAGLIDEDKALRIKLCLGGAPGLSSRGDVRAVLLAGVRGFF